MHTRLDVHGNLPTLIRITDGRVRDVAILEEAALESARRALVAGK